jgi:hypothetical protein
MANRKLMEHSGRIRKSSGGPVKSLEEAKKLDPEQILVEMQERRNLMRDMVGQLYPSILAGEIEQLHEEYRRKRYGTK